jgi:3-oxoacyl-[acyl-carrier-protein] synthase II
VIELKRVVVTGMGALTPFGEGVDLFWESLCAGRSAVGPITHFDTTEFETKIAAEVRDFDPGKYLSHKEARKVDPFAQYALAASSMALEDSGLIIEGEMAERVGVIIGAGLGGLTTIEEFYDVLRAKGPRRVSPFYIPKLIANMAPGYISMFFGLKGPNECVVTACASGTHSIGNAFRTIQRGDALAMLCGGAEATITPMGVSGFTAMRALSTRNEEPEKASRPFEFNRDGFVIGEGAGILILEDLQNALDRDARIYAEVTGFGMTADAYHITAPSPDGDGAARCMKMAIDDAGMDPGEVAYVNAHGTSTKYNDLMETLAIKTVFGEKAHQIPVSSIKSMIGHLLGAAGAVEAISTIKTIETDRIPPTINYEVPDPECDLDYVPNEARDTVVDAALSNNFGFGGTNASLLLKKFTP